MRTVFLVLLIISSIGIILSTLLMGPKAEGMGSIAGGESNVFGKGASRGKESLLNKATAAFGVLFLISSILVATFS